MKIYNRMASRAALPEDVEESRTIEFVASDNSRDSHGTVLPVDKWDLTRFNKNGVITYQHSYYSSDPDNVIGKGTAVMVDNKLLVRITFEPADINPKAEKVFRKILAGTLNGVSVTFMPNTREIGHWGSGSEGRNGETPTFYFDGMELLEVSVVTIPSNPNAIRRNIQEIAREIIGVDPATLSVGNDADYRDIPDTPADEQEIDTTIERARLLI